MRFDVLTLFPDLFRGPLETSILGKARASGLLEVVVHDLRQFTEDRHRTADDYPYGGGAGMVLMAEPIFRAFETVLPERSGARCVYLTPQGRPLDQATVRRLAGYPRIVMLCGHYEGTDERVRQALFDEEISIGDYVLTGGELPALVLIDAVSRLVPGVLGAEASSLEESFSEGLLEYPHYTRPAVLRGLAVPEVLLSGHHEMVRRWRRRESLRRTLERRPDLLLTADLTVEDNELLREIVAASSRGTQDDAAPQDERGSD